MYGSSVVLVLQTQRYELVGVLDAIYKVGTTLYHALVNQFLERFFLAGNAQVEEEFVPEAAIDEVTGSMLAATHIQIYVLPVFIGLLANECLAVVRIHVAQVVG